MYHIIELNFVLISQIGISSWELGMYHISVQNFIIHIDDPKHLKYLFLK